MGRSCRAASLEPPTVQGENLILEEDYMENSIANGGRGYENGDDAVTQTILRVLKRVDGAQSRVELVELPTV
ncbi:hypothetical protein J1N35_029266 [Gossypium stocksii]|uniref:Uncharacterized protein n=1 Tax=Gossypium stocksii TaxID=47602 RepID=A0A9D3UZP7_9ROSI|nr:hypothetical protein J1N35_029266 [Gossypium stocksii]